MKTVILVLACATLAASVRDKRSYGHGHAYSVPLSVYTEVRPSNTLPVYEYPESTEIHTHSNTVYSVSVPITHTVHYEQPAHSRQVYYHNQPAYTSYAAQQVYRPQVYTPQVYSQAYRAPVYTAPRVYTGVQSPWPYRRYADPWC